MANAFTRDANQVISLNLTMTRSVDHPEYQYVPSRNIYWQKLNEPTPAMKGLAYLDHQTEAFCGNWRSKFTNPEFNRSKEAPLHVEIGCNAGHVVLEWAKQNPNACYIGLDWKVKQVYRFAEKIQKNELKNLLAFRANAERLAFMFAPQEIDFLHMFFPDPWPKKSHLKNRTANAGWLKKVAPLLNTSESARKSGRGIFHLKTDHAGYFEFILSELETLQDTYEVFDISRDLHAGNPLARQLKIPDVTLFERLFIKDGLPIHSVKMRPRVS